MTGLTSTNLLRNLPRSEHTGRIWRLPNWRGVCRLDERPLVGMSVRSLRQPPRGYERMLATLVTGCGRLESSTVVR